jgi:hypothetical protein
MFTTNDEYLGYEISYENEKDIQQKLEKCVQIMRILNNTFKTCSSEVF